MSIVRPLLAILGFTIVGFLALVNTESEAPPRHTTLLLSADDIDEIRDLATAGDVEINAVLVKIETQAQKALKLTPRVVSGVYPNDKAPPRAHYRAISNDSDNALNLALAYAITQDLRYGHQAALYLRSWSAELEPSVTGYQAGIELSITLPTFFLAADLIRDLSYFDNADKLRFAEWAKQFAFSMKRIEKACCGPTHNINNWEWAMELAAGILSNEDSLIERSISNYKDVVDRRFMPDLRLVSEGQRSLEYSFFGLSALTTLAELSRHRNVDLYNYGQPGKTLCDVALQHHRWLLDKTYPGPNADYEEVRKVNYSGLAALYYSLSANSIFERSMQEYDGDMPYDIWISGPIPALLMALKLANESDPMSAHHAIRCDIHR